MATAATIKKNIAKLEAALKSKATPKSLKPKLETQLVKSKAELSGMNKGTKPKTSSTKSTQTALQKLKEMVNKNKKYKTYKGAGVDLEKDADRPALRTGKRIAKESGKTYYEYRANRIDVKQPPKKYPKLEKGGYMAKGGEMAQVNKMSKDELKNWLSENYGFRGVDGKGITKDLKDRTIENMRKEVLSQMKYNEKNNVKYAKGGMSQGYDDREDERLGMEHGKMSKKDLDSKHARRDDARFEERGKMAKGGRMDEPKYDSAGFSREDDKRIKIYSGNKGKLNEIFNEYKNQKNELRANEVFDNEKMKGKSVFLFVNDDFYDQYVQDADEEAYSDENFGFAKGGYMAKGGEVDKERMYNFLKDDLVALKKAIELNNQDEIDKFFSYWNIHLKSLEPKTGSKRMYEFLKDDLVGLEAATKELPSSKEETDRFFSYWNTHLKSLSDEDLMNMMAKGGYMAKGGKVGMAEWAVTITSEDGESYDWDGFAKSEDDALDKAEKEAGFGSVESSVSMITDENGEKIEYAKGGISEKEVVESNAEMVLSQIKAVKHHAQELSNVVSKNSDIEAWVVAKIERASTDLSDITHYLEFQTKKMAMGGEMHRTQE